jgi:3-hydroxybutyryl-CoA dehydratase
VTQGTTLTQVGAALPAISKTITQAKLHAYADAGGDHNPLHLDEDFAATTQFGGTIAHGLLVLAYVSEMMTAAFGEAWPASGRLKVRFRAPARPGDTVTTFGSVTSASDGRVTCEIGCRNQAGEVLIDGTAEVAL